MPDPHQLTDRRALRRHRARAQKTPAGPALFLHRNAMAEIQERLNLVNRRFTDPAIIAAFTDPWRDLLPGARLIADDETLDLQPLAHDLVIHAMALHWANDPVGQLIQARRALRPDGLFLAIFPGGRTLQELRVALARAEIAISGGLSPRIAPMGEIRDLGGLLQRAGFALPVADAFALDVRYENATHLMHDLRAMGETNALAARNRRPLRRAIITETNRIYAEQFAENARIPATFELITLTGWAPSSDQPKPLRPGSATARLAEALNTTEQPLDDPAKPDPV